VTILHTPALDAAIDAILARVGGHLVCGTPLGLGKPVPLLNALYTRVKADPARRLSIITALSLEIPRAKGELEQRFLEPFARRTFKGVPQLDYLRDLRRGALPAHIEVLEFYFRPGAMLEIPAAQQRYISSNYTHIARDMGNRGVNVVLVMVAERDGRYSLSCNPDLTLDVVAAMRARGAPCIVVAQVNRDLPFMGHDADVGEDFFDVVVDAPPGRHPLFGVPNPSIDHTDHAIGILAASLVKDGGSLQLGIGSLGDAVAHWLRVRQTGTASFIDALDAVTQRHHSELVKREGGVDIFSRGLFASSEMFSWGLLTLLRAGVIRRRADGDTGPVLQAAFFLGPGKFYEALRELAPDERELVRMTSVLRVNDLYGEEEWLRQRLRHARFINVCMKVTLAGAVVSDGLADGRVVSGVGGQYNFVAMAHELENARSILLLRSTHSYGARTESNVVFNYAHTTIPRHLRDIVVTEYGIADLRGRTDAEVAAALIAIADARFQDELTAAAKKAGKLPRDWRVPDTARANTPERLGERMAPLASCHLLPLFPLGTDFDDVEQELILALLWLKARSSSWRGRLSLAGGLIGARPLPEHALALARMGLATPRSLKEKILQRLVTLGLDRSDS